MIMVRFIEYTDYRGRKQLVNLNRICCIVDRNKTIDIVIGDCSVQLAISYETVKAWITEGSASPILSAGSAL